MDQKSTFLTAMVLTTAAGLSTTVGSAIALFYRTPGQVYMAFTLGFSAGVMVLVSFVELLPQGMAAIGFAWAHTAFFVGMLVMFIVDILLPHTYILEDSRRAASRRGTSRLYSRDTGRLGRASVLVALGVAIHNFPEGMVTFAGAMNDVDTGIALAAAIAIHNIPEGIAVAVPVFASTGSASKAFKWSFLSGVSEPVGALAAGLVLMRFMSDTVLGWTMCVVAGFMVFISFDELLPVAHSYRKEHVAIAGVMSGMIVMAVSLALLA